MEDRLIPTRLPRPFDPERGAEALSLMPELDGDLASLIAGTAGSSPYLAGLIGQETDWLRGALETPLRALSEEGARLQALDPLDPALGAELRRGKRRMALIVALADLGGAWTLEQVTGALTDFADLATGVALRAALSAELKRGKLSGMDEGDLDTGCGLVMLAMGKMGAGELNYSSDIDLIALYDEDRFEDPAEARPALIRAVRKMATLLSEPTGEGYVFRTDLRLRPDPSVTPVCVGMEAAERYYESLGRTWERAAYIKARPCAGDLERGQTFLEGLRPFVWRRHLDYAAIQDAHAVRLAIRDSKGYHGPLSLPGHDMKLGRGGIREIEFFAQFHQLIAGGRDPSLRLRATVPALHQLSVAGWLPSEAASALVDHYRAHREVEHRVQMIHDAQTHKLPSGEEGLARLAALMGRDEAGLREELTRRLTEVHEITEAFFAPDSPGEVPAEAVQSTGFDDEMLERWHHYPAFASTRAREIFKRLRPQLLASLARAARPEEALLAFDGFLKGLPAGVQLFSLFEANPQLIDLIGDICGTVPELAFFLSRNSGVLDAVIGGSFFDPWPGNEALSADLLRVLKREEDYEAKLDAARRWQKEWHFRIGVHHLRGLIPPEEAGAEYAGLAEAVLRALWPVVQSEFARRHGPPPGRGAVVMAMGSMGAGRLNARSDLDLIVIYDADGQEASEGRRPLPSRVYYARLTQALVTALSAPMAEGRLYEVDMRLRPSGNQGPVATSLASYRDYQQGTAWTWEHLALTRARVVAGPAPLSAEVMAFRDSLIAPGRARGAVLRDVAEMRARILAAKGAGAPWEVKVGPGRNQEIELIAQAGGLIAGDPEGWIGDGLRLAVGSGWMHEDERDLLVSTYRLLWNVGQVGKLLSGRVLEPGAIGEGGRALLLRDTGADTLEELESAFELATRSAGEAITEILAREADAATGESEEG
ncbi:MAG: bifunctional [glutamine synthetase] adenylyltransferase/[glutamine synthetase]-adenylyl-L-tyrosine phosphorylase [Rhodobacteraceae bacterium]|nr:bifunctional [glutamine synthetase] adenylyltransferase/[glutamine synthetase]-adenylyl-L-tyrosine phosphorylase [Paracoccaceae bacterium]MBR9822246.1 bifunctional [glutamine synthetase] adenylyltransferase/[glutamine synthetase]-adenylyl-L-tyrosine phosphorylase [Paracoccaceae bacterium]